jgi:hypothetical protein
LPAPTKTVLILQAAKALGQRAAPAIAHYDCRPVPVAQDEAGGYVWTGAVAAQAIWNPVGEVSAGVTLCHDQHEFLLDLYIVALAAHPSNADPASRSAFEIAHDDYFPAIHELLEIEIEDETNDIGALAHRIEGAPEKVWIFVSGDRAGCVQRARYRFVYSTERGSLSN